jgi:hypothetical protein
VSGLSCPESQQVSEERYALRMAATLARWRRRAGDHAVPPLKRAYAFKRVAALQRPYASKLAKCGSVGRITKCGCRGRRDVRWHTCRQHLACESCRARRAKRMGARLSEALHAMAERHPTNKLVLITLTLRHSGDIAADRARLAAGWRAFYKRLHALVGRYEYVGVWEVTAGDDGLGHIHAHVVASWPWLDWSELADMWRRSCPESTRISFVAARRDRQPTTPKSAANYLSKYVAKGVQTADFSPELRADVIAAAYNTRWLFSSRGVWIPFQPLCPDCGQPIILARYRFHAGNWRPDHGPDPPRDHAQLALALPDPDKRASRGCAR